MARRRPSIITTLKERVPSGERILVALSGGKDSSVLLHGLLRVRRLLDLRLEACHVDHGLRKESAADAVFVERLCRELGVPCHVARLGKRPAKVNMEAWARDERYRVFREVMRRNNLNLLVTAHTANDVAETLLMRLFANKELTTIEESDRRRRCLRPLLGIAREQIEEFVREHRVPFVEDQTNSDTALVRNRIRHKVIPQLERDFDPSMVWILAERAQAAAADCEALQYVARGIGEQIGPVEFDRRVWLERCQRALFPLPYAIKWRVVQCLFTPILGHTVGESRARAILGILESKDGACEVGEGRTLLAGSGNDGLALRS